MKKLKEEEIRKSADNLHYNKYEKYAQYDSMGNKIYLPVRKDLNYGRPWAKGMARNKLGKTP